MSDEVVKVSEEQEGLIKELILPQIKFDISKPILGEIQSTKLEENKE